ncbi:MAG: FAD-binding protein [Planctomycetes bacterium]|nr:FAD-binding protein [Planctomycetota bacterium]
MPYTSDMLELIKKVEATRPERLKEYFPAMSMEEREDILKKFHPDFNDSAFRELRVGPNQGERVPNELADILEAPSLLDPKAVDLDSPDYDTDILIIGGGGAGTIAALVAQEAGCNVLIVTKLRHGDANTMMAEGGIQAADKPADSPAIHFLDTVGGGHFVNDRKLVKQLVHDAPAGIQWLERLGVMFGKDETGSMKVLHGGGTSRKRMHSAGDMTGAEIMRTVRDEARNRDGIEVIEFSPAIELVLDDKGRCAGAVVKNIETERLRVIRAKTTILATGGIGRLHIQGFPTTNHYGATADGLVLGYRAGVKLRFADSVQYHPTGVVYPEQNVGLLITEKVRTLGAQPLNIDGEQFVFNEEPRDVESSAFIRECGERKKGVPTPTGRVGVWLDSPMIDILHGEGAVQRELPAKFRQFQRHGIDISKQPMLVYPTLHYQNGGLWINEESETSVPNLFAAGEVTGGLHGRNRLMGNSLLDIVVFGRLAGGAAAARVRQAQVGRLSLDFLTEFEKDRAEAGADIEQPSPMLLPDYVGKVG